MASITWSLGIQLCDLEDIEDSSLPGGNIDQGNIKVLRQYQDMLHRIKNSTQSEYAIAYVVCAQRDLAIQIALAIHYSLQQLCELMVIHLPW